MKLQDVATSEPGAKLEFPLSQVGLERVQTQVRIGSQLLPALASTTVSLVDAKSRGIHMSRLFKTLNQLHTQDLSWPWLENAGEQMLGSHANLSDCVRLEVSFDWPVLRPALKSQESGWRTYPVKCRLTRSLTNPKLNANELELKVLYSSTCPCSAALSRQVMVEQLRENFAEAQVSLAHVEEWLKSPEATVATPHSQRSEAVCRLKVQPRGGESLDLLKWVDRIEAALGTPVQAAVKREDEQEFARLNAQNLMFCEDAARKLKRELLSHLELEDFQIEVRHFESLHAHDVVAIVGKYE